MNEFLSQLAQRAPQIALAFLAANRGGPQAAAAFQGGLLEAHQRDQALARQARLDEEQRQLRATQEAHLQSSDALAQRHADLQSQQADFQRRQAAVNVLHQAIQQQGETASDPAAAENALLGQATGLESFYGVPSGSLSPMIPNMIQPVNRGVRQDARSMWADAEGRLLKKNKDADVSDSTVSFDWSSVPVRLQRHLVAQGHPEGQPVKPSQIQAVAGAPTITAPPRVDLPNTSEEHFYQAFARENGYKDFESMPTKLQTDARAQWAMAGRRDKEEPRNRFNIQPVTNPDGTTSLIRINMDTGAVSPVSLPNGANAGKAGDTQRLSAAYQVRTAASDKTAKTFERSLISLGAQFDVKLPNLLKSESGQRYRQAKDEFINAALRRESGAAIQPSEYERFDKIYFVMPGDTLATIKQKQAARQRVVAGFKIAAGNLATASEAGDENPEAEPAVTRNPYRP